MRGNATRNQHFLPRVEQKLNALNPGSTSGKFRIYSFRLVNRQTYEIALKNPQGRSIDATLSMLDLFSFDVRGGSRLRVNLEELFRGGGGIPHKRSPGKARGARCRNQGRDH